VICADSTEGMLKNKLAKKIMRRRTDMVSFNVKCAQAPVGCLKACLGFSDLSIFTIHFSASRRSHPN
jgi:hypothetical protein